MRHVADLQLHSRYARAVSKYMGVPEIATWAAKKGIGIVTTGDWQHPRYFEEIVRELEEAGDGVLCLKRPASSREEGVRFVLVSEVACQYWQGGKFRRIHHLIWSPSLAACENVAAMLAGKGADLAADGRPVIGISSRELLASLLEVDPRILLVQAHAWTPWFGTFGSKSGFDSLAECFGDLASQVYAVETGLSADPAMNWRVGELDSRRIVSFSDAHSGPKMGREATVFDLPETWGYADLAAIIKGEREGIAHTVEFYPEEGKYHWTGHRDCGVRYSPEDEKKFGLVCPVCGKKLTVGVAHRAEALADRPFRPPVIKADERWVSFVHDPEGKRPPFVSLVPLVEILQQVLHSPTKAGREYERLVHEVPEFAILTELAFSDLEKLAGERAAHAVKAMRERRVQIEPGYDGVFGTVTIEGV